IQKPIFINVNETSLFLGIMRKIFATLPLIFLSYILVAQPAFTLEDIVLERKFEAKQLRGLSFISDSAYITQETAPDNGSTQVVRHHLDKDEKQILLDTRILANAITGSDFKVNTF